jgi:threonine dehydrogenase-like Zn-dependent dehydrogenase
VSVCLEALAQAKLQPGQRLLILGDGPFGILVARLAQSLHLAANVIAGHHDFRLGFAEPATRLNLKQCNAPAEDLRRASGADGYDAVILGVGRPQAVALGLSLLKAKGRFVVFSAITGPTPVDLFAVHCRELVIVGACNDQNRLDDAVTRLADPTLDLARIVTHRFPLSRYREAFALAEKSHSAAMKVALEF